MRMRKSSGLIASLVLVTMLLAHNDIRAESPAEASPNETATGRSAGAGSQSDVGMDEIIVTARKRPESILKVPVVEIAVPQAKMESLQVTEIADLPKLVPGLDMGQNILTIGTQVAIRGIGTTAYDQGVDQSVALNIDGVSMGSGIAFQSGLFDVGSVEVLKGPQSLFYGKSTTAGVIALRTADPTDKLEAIGRAEYEVEAKTWKGEAIFSGPVADGLKVRLATQYSSSDGYFRNMTVPLEATGAEAPEYNRAQHVSESYKVRLTALWDPSDTFSARFKANVARMDVIDPSPSEIGDCFSGVNGAPPLSVPFIGPYNDCRISRNFYTVSMDPAAFPGILHDGHPFLDTMMEFGSLEMNYHPMREITIDSTTGYSYLKAEASANAFETSYAAPALVAENDYRRHSWSEELRVNSDFSGPINFTGGGYYENGLVSNDVSLLGNTVFGLPSPFEEAIDSIRIKSYSLFGQLRYQLIKPLELAGGLRWTDETRTQDPINLLTGAEITGQTDRIHSSKVMPEFTATYTPTDDLTVFGAYKKGFKSGSFSIATPPTPSVDNAFGDETARGGEVGLKSRWLERRLIANAALYYYTFSGLQVGTTEPPLAGGVPITRTLNAGGARTYGLDLDAAYRPIEIDNLQLSAAANWNHARYTQLTNVPCWASQTIAQGCTESFNSATGLYTGQNLSGTQMVRAPQWQMNLGGSYDVPLANGYKLTFNEANAYTSSYPTALAVGRPENDELQRAFVKVDLGVEFKSPDEQWSVAVIAKNVGDKIVTGTCSYEALQTGVIFPGTITGGATSGAGGVSSPVCFVDPGREIWLRLTVRPFARH